MCGVSGRKGKVSKVDGAVRDGLCQFFGVPLDYFAREHADEVSVLIVRDAVDRLSRDIANLTDAEYGALHRLACEMVAVFAEQKRAVKP